MGTAIYRLWLRVTIDTLAALRRLFVRDKHLYAILGARQLQPALRAIGKMRAHSVFLRAQQRCPAYRQFLTEESYAAHRAWNLENVPVMTKENYVRKFSIEERCYDGAIPAAGVVIDESSGSTGQPNNWIRSRAERDDVKRVLQINYELLYRESGVVLLNCFALGPWATGMNVSLSLVDVGIMKSIGPDQRKLENTLRLLGPKYRYLIFGYPPFIRSFVDETALPLGSYHIDFVVGGEGISEPLRVHLLRFGKTVISSYGASDLEINIGIETALTIAVRQTCSRDGNLSRQLFGRDTPPMIFQYNPSLYVIETSKNGELIFTIGRDSAAAPKIRYNLRDAGGVYTFAELGARLQTFGVGLTKLQPRFSYFPFLFVYGRNDASVPFYGCKVFPTDLEQIISGDPVLAAGIHSFQLRAREDDELTGHLEIHLERKRGGADGLPPEDRLTAMIFTGLIRVNQDFREVTRMFDPSQVRAILHDYETGPFAGRDIRIKNAYIAS
jgi:phenylacetate-CoA ligase